jgi:hypothetical protein
MLTGAFSGHQMQRRGGCRRATGEEKGGARGCLGMSRRRAAGWVAVAVSSEWVAGAVSGEFVVEAVERYRWG